jgi:hypothetical protein
MDELPTFAVSAHSTARDITSGAARIRPSLRPFLATSIALLAHRTLSCAYLRRPFSIRFASQRQRWEQSLSPWFPRRLAHFGLPAGPWEQSAGRLLCLCFAIVSPFQWTDFSSTVLHRPISAHPCGCSCPGSLLRVCPHCWQKSI